MEKIINNVKRKKRKTRRCLDEIRKRAHSFICKSESKENNNNVKSSIKNTSNLRSNSITIQRLTLYPKTIRSETATRPLLLQNNSCERFGKKCKNILHSKVTFDNEILKSIDINPVYLQKNFNSEVNSNNHEIDSERKKYEMYFSNQSSPSSLVLFSPINEREKKQSDQSTSLSSPSSHDEYSYLLYEEVMDEIPVYLKHNALSIMNEDVIADTKSYLRNLYMDESSYSSAQDDGNLYLSDNTINSSPGEILQNPKDYIRQHLYEHKVMYGQDDIKESHSFSHTNKIPFSRKSQCYPQAPANRQMQSIIHITPEYNYFPHRLNE